jgi:lactate permease
MFWKFLLALLPILVVLVLMIKFRWGGAKAGPVGWLTALVVAVVFFGAGPSLLAYSQMRAFFMTIYVLYVVWMALILYNTVLDAGVIAAIGRQFIRVTEDRVLQLLLLSWVFSSFLQGVAGYGVPIAVVAPLLITLGFEPVTSVAAVAIGHAWSVTFGSMAASFNALMAASALPGATLAPASALLLGFCCFACAIAACYTYDGLKAVRRGIVAILIIGAVMAGVQYALAVSGLWNIAAFVAGLAGLGATFLVSRLPLYRNSTDGRQAPETALNGLGAAKPMPPLLAIVPYVMLIAIVCVAEIVEPVHQVLNSVKVQMAFPATTTALGWVTAAGKGQSISIFGHAGALLIYASVAAFALLSLTGYYKPGALKRILTKTTKSAVNSSIGIATMVGFALIMEQSGMTNAIAVAITQGIAPLYAFTSPFIGLLGSFMTGSNTNSNVVFTGLQLQTAQLLQLPVAVILGAQTTGGALGGMLAPARIIVGASTAGLVGKEGQVLRRTVVYGVIITALTGVIIWVVTRQGLGF